MLRYALPYDWPTALAYWILQLSSTYILLAFSSSTEVGVYGIATRCANAANMIASAFFTSYTAYAFQQANEDPEAPKKFSTIMNIFVFLFATACTAGSLFGPEIIHLMTTPDYAAASFMLPGVLFGQLFYNVYRIAGYGVSFSKQSKYLAFPIFAAAGCALAGYLLLIPRLGGIGASVSLCVAYAVMAIMVFRFAQRLYPCPYEDEETPRRMLFLPRKLVRARFPVTAHPGRGMPRLHRVRLSRFSRPRSSRQKPRWQA